MKIIEILRLYEMRMFTMREIGSSTGCSKTTVSKIISRCRECGLTYDDAKDMSQERINELIYPDSLGRKQVKEEPDWGSIHKRLQANRRLNLQYIWEEEYRINNPEGYSYSRFCAKYNMWRDKTGKHVNNAEFRKMIEAEIMENDFQREKLPEGLRCRNGSGDRAAGSYR